MQFIEPFFRNGTIHITPPNTTMAAGLIDDEFVIWRATRVLAGSHHQWT
jgi:hypothetical protein